MLLHVLQRGSLLFTVVPQSPASDASVPPLPPPSAPAIPTLFTAVDKNGSTNVAGDTLTTLTPRVEVMDANVGAEEYGIEDSKLTEDPALLALKRQMRNGETSEDAYLCNMPYVSFPCSSGRRSSAVATVTGKAPVSISVTGSQLEASPTAATTTPTTSGAVDFQGYFSAVITANPISTCRAPIRAHST